MSLNIKGTPKNMGDIVLTWQPTHTLTFIYTKKIEKHGDVRCADSALRSTLKAAECVLIPVELYLYMENKSKNKLLPHVCYRGSFSFPLSSCTNDIF